MSFKSIQIKSSGISSLIPSVVEFSWGKARVIGLGERGRGRKLVYIHCVGHGNVWNISSTRSGFPKLKAANGSPQAWILRINTNFAYTRGTVGSAAMLYPTTPRPLDRVLAFGWGAWGDAGRIGRWYDYLVTLETNTLVGIWWAGGRRKREPSYLWLPDLDQDPVLIPESEIDLWLDQHPEIEVDRELIHRFRAEFDKLPRERRVWAFHQWKEWVRVLAMKELGELMDSYKERSPIHILVGVREDGFDVGYPHRETAKDYDREKQLFLEAAQTEYKRVFFGRPTDSKSLKLVSWANEYGLPKRFILIPEQTTITIRDYSRHVW